MAKKVIVLIGEFVPKIVDRESVSYEHCRGRFTEKCPLFLFNYGSFSTWFLRWVLVIMGFLVRFDG